MALWATACALSTCVPRGSHPAIRHGIRTFELARVSPPGRGCVKTHRADAPSNIDLSERSVFDYFSLRKGKRTPETETALRFHTASVVNRLLARINVKLLSYHSGRSSFSSIFVTRL